MTTATLPTYQHLLASKKTIEGSERMIGWVQLNRPKAYNALCNALMTELANALHHLDTDPSVGAIVVTGNEKAFAAGADITELASQSAMDMHLLDPISHWEAITRCKTPTIAAVNGFALGGGCELMMMCDMAIAGTGAKFGQPEVSIGVIPGAGGTQRLTRAIGKARAMQLILTGANFSADEAYAMGLLSQVVADEDVTTVATQLAETIAKKPAMAIQAAKHAVNQAAETTLSAGITLERQLFHLTFASADKNEGMAAFSDKRKPAFTHN